MSRFLVFSSNFLPLLLIAFGVIASASGQVVLSEDEPTTDLLASQLNGGIFSTIHSEANDDDHARGQLFPLGVGEGDGFEITAITIRKSSTQTFNNDILTVRIFEGTQGQFATGTGHTSVNNGDNFYAGTTVTPIHFETFKLSGEFTDDIYVTFNFATPVLVNESSDFGFLMTYDPGEGDQDRFLYLESTAGGRIVVRRDDHKVSNRSFHYAVHGTAVPVLLGDVNLDNVVDFFDIAPFIERLTNGGSQVEADINRNGVVDFSDIAPFIVILTS